LGDRVPPESDKANIFWANAKFFRQKLAAENETKYLLNENTEFIPSSEMKCPKSEIFTNNYWVGESGKTILQVSIRA